MGILIGIFKKIEYKQLFFCKNTPSQNVVKSPKFLCEHTLTLEFHNMYSVAKRLRRRMVRSGYTFTHYGLNQSFVRIVL